MDRSSHIAATAQMIDDVHTLRAALGEPGPQIVVEVIERTLIRNTDQTQKNLATQRDEGVLVAIDDFGTGYCSLTCLERFPFDLLKIDRGFVLAIDPNGSRTVVLDSIIDLARSLGAQLVAEGVETRAQFDYLRARGGIRPGLSVRAADDSRGIPPVAPRAGPRGAKRPAVSGLRAATSESRSR